jgi:hypothetical protein
MQCEYVSPDNKFCKDMAPRYDGERWLCVKHYDAAIARTATLTTIAPLKDVYDKFKPRDALLSEVGCKGGDAKTATAMEIAGELWISIKESLRTAAQEARR